MNFFFFPDNESPGDLEDLLLRIINPEHQIIIDCFQEYQGCLENVDDYILPNKKAMIFAYCEALLPKKEAKKIREEHRDYLDEKLWNIHSEFLEPIKEFLRDIIESADA